MRLFWIFVIIPIIEIALFIQVGGLIGLLPTLALVVLSAVVGVILLRSQGARAMLNLQNSFRELQDPTRPLAHGIMILFAGALLLTPGFFTDTLGLLLLSPRVRDWVIKKMASQIQVHRAGFGFEQPQPPKDPNIIDADYVVEPETKDTPPSGWTRL